MKTLSFITLAMILAFSSCTSVLFETPQPKGVAEQKEFPKNYIGQYIDTAHKDTLTIAGKSFQLGHKSSSFNIHDSLSSGLSILKTYNEYYILSEKEINNNETAWEVFTCKLINDNLSVYYILLSKDNKEEIIKKLKGILEVKEIKDTDGKINHYLINPTKRTI